MITTRDIHSHFAQRVVARRIGRRPAPWPLPVCGHVESNADGTATRECRREAGHPSDHDYGFWTYPKKESA